MSDYRLSLRSTDPLRPDLRYVINTQNQEKFHEWKKAITGILQTQHDFLKAIISPIAYQKELTKESWVRNYTTKLNQPMRIHLLFAKSKSIKNHNWTKIKILYCIRKSWNLYIASHLLFEMLLLQPEKQNQYQWAMKLKCILWCHITATNN